MSVNLIGFEKGNAITFQSLTIDATLQAVFGKVLFRSVNAVAYTAAQLAAGQTVYYSSLADMLLPARSWVVSDDTTLAYAVSPALRLGVTETLFATWYPASAYTPGQPREAVGNSPVVRVGPSFGVLLRDRTDGPLARIEVFGALQWYARDRYRTANPGYGAIPFCLLGVRVGGSLWKR